jgi:SAM-dependent methyltransferase
MSGAQLYDTIGATYAVTRRTEPRIAAQVWAALGDARTVLNVGAGTGSYEPAGRDVTAVEPSAVMRAQRPAGAAPCVAGFAESLPFEDQSFDAAMAFATIDHWTDPIAGLREMRRVARRVVVLTCDASDPDRFWLTRDYLPEHNNLWAGRPSLTELAHAIAARTEPVRTMSRCHRKMMPGVTISRIAARRSIGIVPASRASNARSGHVSPARAPGRSRPRQRAGGAA